LGPGWGYLPGANVAGRQQNIVIESYGHLYNHLFGGWAGKSSIQPAIHLSIHPSIYAVQQVMQRSSLTRTMKPLLVLLALVLLHSTPPIILQILHAFGFTNNICHGPGCCCLHTTNYIRLRTQDSGLCWLFGNPLFQFSETSPPPQNSRPLEQTNMLCLKRTYWTYSCCWLLLFLMLFVCRGGEQKASCRCHIS